MPFPVGLLDRLNALGPFFAVHSHLATARPHSPWHPMGELLERPELLRERVRLVREQLARNGGQAPEYIEPRVAASVTHQAMTARLISPVLASAVLADTVLAIELGTLWWQRPPGGPMPLSVPEDASEGPVQNRTELAEAVARRVLQGPVAELGAAFRTLSVSDAILWGNVASAVNGARIVLHADAPERAAAFAARLHRHAPLRGCSTISADGIFRRRSCCLIYRAAPGKAGGLCGDCVLASR
ncbi:MAG: (2Fe-2S)-binding protein [Sciscionella sp.]